MKSLAVATLAVLPLADAAFAQEGGPRGAQPEGWSVSLGAGAVFGPIYQGADDYGLSVFPDIRLAYGDRFFASVPEGLGANLINTPSWKAGPIARIRFGRDDDNGGSPFLLTGETDDLAGLGDIPAAAELGGFVEHRNGAFRLRAETRRGFGAHQGIIGDLSARYARRFASTLVTAGPTATFATADYVDRYFGIDAGQSLASGLPAFDPDGGLVSYGAGVTAVRPLNRRVTAAFIANYERIAGDAADSPIVRDLGDADQVTAILSLSYRFGGR
ncbi:MAG: MipA/OmpV family protein [Parvularculaceae bacterium]|nr:MipA/OmpV family protein [Parvularculaceae bacterium]